MSNLRCLGKTRFQPGRHDPPEPRASAPEGPAYATGKTSTPEIESQRTARRPMLFLSQTKPRVPHPSAFFALGWETMLPTRPLAHQNNSVIPPVAKQLCHPDRSEAEWRDLVFRLIARGLTCVQPTMFWEGPRFSRAVTIPMNTGLQHLRDLPTRRERRSRQKSNRSGWRVTGSRLASSTVVRIGPVEKNPRPCAGWTGRPPE